MFGHRFNILINYFIVSSTNNYLWTLLGPPFSRPPLAITSGGFFMAFSEDSMAMNKIDRLLKIVKYNYYEKYNEPKL